MEQTKKVGRKTGKGSIFYTVAMRGLVAFPKMIMHFDVAREKSLLAVEKALQTDGKLFLVTQRDDSEEEPDVSGLYKVGVVAEIRQVLKLPDNTMKVLVEGIYRAEILSLSEDSGVLTAEVKRLPVHSRAKYDEKEAQAYIRSIRDVFEKYSEFAPRIPISLMESVMTENDPVKFFEEIVFNCTLSYSDKQALLEESHVLERLSMLLRFLTSEVEILELENSIKEQTKDSIDKGQKDYYLREQIRIMQEQLGETEEDTIPEYTQKIIALKTSSETKKKLFKEVDRMKKMPPSSPEYFLIKNYLDTVIELPWGKYSKTKLSIEKAESILESEHYGLKKVKERIVEFLAVRILNPDVKGQIICLAGPPGIGKTSIAKSVAKAVGRKYVRVSLGGVRDEADIRGHRKTYVGAMPGRIISALQQAGTANPLMLLDEIDKLCSDIKGDPSSAMLEVLDSEQNFAFRDHFIEVPFDLSKVMFITTANDVYDIPAPLLDRMDVIELPSYTAEEKFHIAKDHLIPKQLKENGLKGTQLRIDNDAIRDMIAFYTKEAGVRNLERTIASVCRKSAKKIASGEAKRVSVNSEKLREMLGTEKYTSDTVIRENHVGEVNGLAWTSVGGVVMPVEVLVVKGTGKIEITGSLGDVMRESAQIAVSYARSVAGKYGIDADFYKENDIHINAVEGAVPKDGPSAGVTMATAIVSALSGKPVRADVAMTGEITLHGKVLPIGGLREKTMASYKAGIKTVIIPKANEHDLDDIDKVVKDAVNFVCAENITQVLDTALLN